MLLLLLLLAPFLTSCGDKATGNPQGADPRKSAVVPVRVAEVVRKTVPIEITAIGNIEAYASVSVKAQVSGELKAVHFKEGQEVKQGDLLFVIDAAPFEARLKQMEANLAKERAQLQNAKKSAERYESVARKGYVSAEQFDDVTATVTTLEASVKADEAIVDSARIELQYCTIRSPISGVTGELRVDRGNIIKANDTENPMVTIRQVAPIYVGFFVPEVHLPEIKKYMTQHPLKVTVRVPENEKELHEGTLTFIDNTVDRNTGTLLLKGTLPNREHSLWPGQYVNVVLRLTTEPDVVVAPSQAVQVGQQGPFVFVVTEDMKAEYRTVTLGRALGEEVVIEKGLGGSEKVVTDGHLRLAPGVKVTILNDSDTATGEAPRS